MISFNSGGSMNKALIILIPLVILGILVIAGLGIYNGVIGAQDEVRASWAKVADQYQKKADCIPALVEIAKGYAPQESSLLAELLRLRSSWGGARQTGNILKKLQAAMEMDEGLAQFMNMVARYPELKSNPNFLRIMDQLQGIDNRIRAEGRHYNLAVMNYNRKILKFPGALFAGPFGFETMPLYRDRG
jgi:LemA protein